MLIKRDIILRYYFALLLFTVTLNAGETFTVTAAKFKNKVIKRSVDIELDNYHKLSVDLHVLGVFSREFKPGDLVEITEEVSIQDIPGKANFIFTNLSTGQKFTSCGEQITSRWTPDENDHKRIFRVLKVLYDDCYDYWDYWTSDGCYAHVRRTIGQSNPESWEVGDQIFSLVRSSDNAVLSYNLRTGNLNEISGGCPVSAIVNDSDYIIWSKNPL